MTLEDYRLEEGLTYARLAEVLRFDDQAVTPETVRRWCLPEDHALHRLPHGRWMRRIFDITAGQVTPNDFAGLGEPG